MIAMLAVVLAVSPPYFGVRYEASARPGGLVLPVTFTAWIPPGAKTLRAVIVHQHGCGVPAGTNALTAAYDLQWQALARKWDCALVGPSYEENPSKGPCSLWCDPRNGSDQAFQRALKDLGAQSGHPELAAVPWALWGHSGGAIWASIMQMLHPDRIAAVWLRSGSGLPAWEAGRLPKPEIPPEAWEIPMGFNVGARELVTGTPPHPNLVWRQTFEAYRKRGALICWAVDPLSGHDCRGSRFASIPFFDACLAQRLPRPGGGQTLRPMDPSRAYFAAADSTAAQPASQFEGDRTTASWLPDGKSAASWSNYVATGGANGSGAPPAPTDLTIDRTGELSWNAQADLENGLAGFIIVRDGREIARLPETPTEKSGVTLFQGVSHGDTPVVVLPPMRFRDQIPAGSGTRRYEVFAVDAAGRRSAAAEASVPELWLPSIFGDHMVVQRGKPFTLWGRGRAGSTISVRADGVEGTCEVGPSGRWRMALPPLTPAGPFIVTVKGEGEAFSFRDVVLGDVWLGGGQSNMAWKLPDSVGGQEAIAHADLPRLRVFLQQPQAADARADDVREGTWVVSTPQTAERFWGVPFFFARKLLADTGTNVGIIQAAVGGTVIESWVPREALGPDWQREPGIVEYARKVPRDYEAQYQRWQDDVRKFAAERPPPPNNPWISWGPPGPRYPKRPFALYEGMIAPLQPFALRGVLWYQGEENVSRPQGYERLLTGLIAAWRSAWKDPQLPFLVVQLPAAPRDNPNWKHWPELRAAQQQVAAQVPHVYLCVTLDLGDPATIHPRNKQPLGERLARLAERHAEGRQALDSDGPKPQRVTAAGRRVTISFAPGPGRLELTAGGGFALAGADRVFKPAIGTVTGNDSVTVECAAVPDPRYVSCEREPDPAGWVLDGAGLPAAPFSRAIPSLPGG